jgi:hypothetical protein
MFLPPDSVFFSFSLLFLSAIRLTAIRKILKSARMKYLAVSLQHRLRIQKQNRKKVSLSTNRKLLSGLFKCTCNWISIVSGNAMVFNVIYCVFFIG